MDIYSPPVPFTPPGQKRDPVAFEHYQKWSELCKESREQQFRQDVIYLAALVLMFATLVGVMIGISFR